MNADGILICRPRRLQKAMNEPTLARIRQEIASAIIGRRVGKIFQLSRLSFAIDFRGEYLFFSTEPSSPRVYLIKRRLRDLEKASMQQLSFAQFLKKRITGAAVMAVEKIAGERALVVRLAGATETGEPVSYSLVLQLTGRSANVLLVDAAGRVVERLRDTRGDGQDIATVYAPPARSAARIGVEEAVFDSTGYESLSEALDEHYLERESARRLHELAGAARAKARSELARSERLAEKLRADLAQHGDPEIWKRNGDLILANLADAVAVDGKLLVVDYYDDATPVVEIEIDPKDELTVAAEKFFKRYTKARNAQNEIERRLKEIDGERSDAAVRLEAVESMITSGDGDGLASFLGRSSNASDHRRKLQAEAPSGTRRFISMDGFEILVGKGAKDNDNLTFRIARSWDLWLHAADYPGSHVVVRNTGKGEIPSSTILEAARLAAFYSQAREHPKAAVHYTLRKHVHKPKGGVPGLVSLTQFKTILVESSAGEAL